MDISKKRNMLIIFTRYPVPGQTKTRLIADLGKTGAADIQRRLLEKILMTSRQLTEWNNSSVEVRFDGGSEIRMRIWLGSEVIVLKQPDGSLGRRILISFS